MATRAKRDTRFSMLRGYFNSHNKAYMTDEQVKVNITETGAFIYASEFEKFFAEYPDINVEAFDEWVKKFGALKVAGKSKTTGVSKAALKSPEKATELGVLPENVDFYITHINAMLAEAEFVNSVVPEKKLNHYFSDIKKKEEAEVETKVSNQ